MRKRGTHRREQIEFLAHRRHYPGGVAARIGGMPDRTHDPAVELPQHLLGNGGKRMSVLLVPALADRQLLPINGKAFTRGGGFHHLDAFRHDFEPDVVARQDTDLHVRFINWYAHA
jgi:hypothetical protein